MPNKTYSCSEQTKHALVEALKTLMKKKALAKITIQEITALCGLRRQTFYYYFEDIYDLLRWMIQEEAVSLLKQHDGTLLWQEGLLQLFQYLDENRAVYLCALNSMGRNHIRQLFEQDIYAIIHYTVQQIGQGIDVEGIRLSKRDTDMMTQFYVLALAGIVESWLKGELDQTPHELINFADVLLQDHIRGARLRLKETPNKAAPTL